MTSFANLNCVGIILLAIVYSDAYIRRILPRLPLKGTPVRLGTPWPLPNSWTTSNSILAIDPWQFTFLTNIENCDIVNIAIQRYRKLIFYQENYKTGENMKLLQVVHLHIASEDCEKYPHQDMDEKYHIRLTHKEAEGKISANSIWGALRGLETFSQLVHHNENSTYVLNETHISDKPRFQHRGILLDSARHFVSKIIILKNLDAMAYNKMNVFHWHLVDDQSFPYQSKTFPELSEKGAYSSAHIYTQLDISEIIEYARQRGIRVIPEFDTPAHTWSWGKSHPELLTPCYGEDMTPNTAKYPHHAERETINPTLESTYDFLEKLLMEIAAVFPDKQTHLGMDEASKACWESNPNIRHFMDLNGLGTFKDLEAYYFGRVQEMIETRNLSSIIWQDMIDNGVTPNRNTLVQVWKDESIFPGMIPWQQSISATVKKGYKAILSACWYLNMISYKNEWKAYYTCDPHHFSGSQEEKSLVVGGEACLWGTFVDDTNLLPRLWPRASAVAERLWSNQVVNSTDDAQYRLDQHRCRMVRRGIPAQPIFNGFCENEYKDITTEENNETTTMTRSTSRATDIFNANTFYFYIFLIHVCYAPW